MTREEAKRTLEFFSVCSENHVVVAVNARDRQALHMAIEALSREPSEDTISRQAAIDALRTCYDTETISMDNGDEYINYGDAVGEIEQLPSAQPEQTDCEYCYEDGDGYVTPLEKNCYAIVRCSPMDGWVLSIKYGAWRKDIQINYCPMCGRRLTDG